MPIETEAKFKVESHESVRRRLESLGAVHMGEVIETNCIVDRADKSLQKRGCGLRVRSTVSDSEGTTTTLTFKGVVAAGTLKSREELEVSVDDADSLSEILLRLGFAPILTYQKRRESWRMEECQVELDEPPHIGRFVEIEGPTVDAIRQVQSKLGLADEAHVRSSYVQLLCQYCKDHNLQSRTLGLDED